MKKNSNIFFLPLQYRELNPVLHAYWASPLPLGGDPPPQPFLYFVFEIGSH
jgi:hypothetical protein